MGTPWDCSVNQVHYIHKYVLTWLLQICSAVRTLAAANILHQHVISKIYSKQKENITNQLDAMLARNRFAFECKHYSQMDTKFGVNQLRGVDWILITFYTAIFHPSIESQRTSFHCCCWPFCVLFCCVVVIHLGLSRVENTRTQNPCTTRHHYA